MTTPSDIIESPDSRLFDQFDEQLRVLARRTDYDETWPVESLQLCRRYDFFRWFCDPTCGGLFATLGICHLTTSQQHTGLSAVTADPPTHGCCPRRARLGGVMIHHYLAPRNCLAPAEPKKQIGFHTIRDSAKGQSEPSKPTSSAKRPKRRRRTDA
jgi:hypothetical protein